jgi:hypothetical protein
VSGHDTVPWLCRRGQARVRVQERADADPKPSTVVAVGEHDTIMPGADECQDPAAGIRRVGKSLGCQGPSLATFDASDIWCFDM